MTAPPISDEPTVFVVADAAVLEAVKGLARSQNLRVRSYPSLETLLSVCTDLQAGCLVCDPAGNAPLKQATSARIGLWFEELACRQVRLPVILLASDWDVPSIVQAMRWGAFNVLETPCSPEALGAAIGEALARDRWNRSQRAAKEKLERRLARLTPGENEVLQMLLDGLSNKDIAEQLGLSVRAIEARRAKVMEKTHTGSLAELIRVVVTVRGG